MNQAEQEPTQVVPKPGLLQHVSGIEPELARLQGYRVVDLELGQGASPVGRHIADLEWPSSSVLLAIRRGASAITVSEQTRLRFTLVVPAASAEDVSELVDQVRPAGGSSRAPGGDGGRGGA
ncbi:MAG TPA: hypothetical protein VH112_11520 [Acidimicrobiales bacterium]|nr:hypothetical protein [Acidimicrobiales bacterium]